MRGDLGEGQLLGGVGAAEEPAALAPLDVTFVHLELFGGAGDHLGLDVFGGQVAGMTGCIRDTAAAGAVVVADGVGVDDCGFDALDAQPQRLGDDHGHGRAGAADVG